MWICITEMETVKIYESPNNIIETVIHLMQQVETFNKYSGEDKKKYVFDAMETILGSVDFYNMKDMIENLIEFAIKLSKKEIQLNFNIKKYRKFCCH